MKRIIIDTNLWISFLITNNYNQLDLLIIEEKCKLLFSKELLNEFISVCRRPKLRKYFSEESIEDVIEIIDDYAEFVDVLTSVELCRNPKDNFLLSLGIDGNADYHITGDKDLLVLENVGELEICTMTEFLQKI
jgi:putative PIN family toxin of toxin-antitoxin system